MNCRPLTLAFAFTLATQAQAQEAADVAALHAALRLDEIVDIMALEGIAYGEEIAGDLFPGAVPADWAQVVAAIYDAERMRGEVRDAFATALDGRDIGGLVAFFTAEPGASFIALEVSARAAMLDETVEEMAKEAGAVAVADQTPRYGLIAEFVAANDLIETNVVSAMNSNFAFYMGLMDGGALSGELSEDQILSDVWAQEPEIRASTTEWVYSFLLMAYDPLSDVDIETYIAFSETDDGKLLNQAIFAAFDGMFSDISHALGQASARYMVTQEL